MPEPQKIPFVVPDDLEPRYINTAYVTHTPHEFILDFATMMPGLASLKLNTRLILSPQTMKLFQRAINENIARYEANFGEIRIPRGHTLADELFREAGGQNPPDEQK